MSQRRQFMQKLGIGALGAFALGAHGRVAAYEPPALDKGTGKKVRVGIIGAENSHSRNFGNMFNTRKVFPGVEAVAIWGETREFAEFSAKEGNIPKIVDRQEDLLGMVDALIIDHRHAKYHVEAAIPFVEKGIPTFVDKPFAYRYYEARSLMDLAEKNETPITSLSSVGYGPEVDDMAEQVSRLEDIHSVVITGPSDIDSKYGGIFFYAIHTVERLFKLFGSDVEAVRCTRNRGRFNYQFKYANGMTATYIPIRGWDVHVALSRGGDSAMQQIKPAREYEDAGLYMYAAIVRMFQTGEEPRTHESIIKPIATLEAMEKSAFSEDWEYPLV